jgi:hypothetical protein
MEKSANETVIIVHGTWAAPDPAERKWYQPNDERPCGEPFIDKLDAALKARGSSARCWAHCGPENPAFHWSGENSWIDRTLAASALADYVAKLRTEGWHCHIVAHSHGGNVLVEALPHIMTSLDSQKPQAKLVTLGTPFLDTTSPILQRIKTRIRLLQFVSWISFASVIAFATNDVRSNWKELRWNELNSDHILFGLAAVFLLAIFFGRMRRSRDERGIDDASQTQPKVLAVGSPYDEAWQILYHLRRMENPIAIKSNFFGYLFSSVRSTISQGKTVARIHGAKSFRDLGIFAKLALVLIYLSILPAAGIVFLLQSWIPYRYLSAIFAVLLFLLVLASSAFFGETFFSAFWSPFRWCFRRAGSLASIFPSVATYGVRSAGWPVLLKMIMGLESYRFKIPEVEQQPGYVTYEDMPIGAQLRALDKRNAWIAGHLGDITETFARLAVTAADITSLLKSVEKDETLVHAAYYTDEECIARIAEWIAKEA